MTARAAIDKRTLGRWALTGAAGVTLAFILLPLIFVTWLAFFEQAIPSFPPRGYSLKWFVSISDNPRFVDGFWLSLRVAMAAMFIGLALGVPAALCLARYRFPGREPLGNLVLLPLVVPGIVLGTSLYVFHVEATILTALPILGSMAGLVAGHILIVIPWTVRLVSASLAGFDRSIEEAAQNLGATPMTTFFRNPVVGNAKVAPDLKKRIGFSSEEEKLLVNPDLEFLGKRAAELKDFWDKEFKGA